MSPSTATVAAVDLGASSGRVVLAHCTPNTAQLREVHRFPNIPVRVNGALRWDVLGLFRGVLDGLQIGLRSGELDAIGVDSWAVDYGLLDADGELLGNPRHYRDAPTSGAVSGLIAELGAPALYQATGTQLQPFNTLFQLIAEQNTAQRAMATTVAMIPDLISYWLSGVRGTEVTNASTTQLLDPRTMQWSLAMLGAAGVSSDFFAPLVHPGHGLGGLRGDVARELGTHSRAQITTVASHDTAAAVAGIPAESDDFAYVCTGTWALVGLELSSPVITEASRDANFTNEVGVDDTIRFLRNVTGFWLLQECARQWRAGGDIVDLDALTDAAAQVPPLRAIIDVQDPAFAASGDMSNRIVHACLATSGVSLNSQAEIVRCILDSMALAVRQALRDAMTLSGRAVSVVHVVGGGVANWLFCQLVADACQLPVVAGPTEAASWGNALLQARALGVGAATLTDSRAIIRASEPQRRYEVSRAQGHQERDFDRADRMVMQLRGQSV